MYKCHVLICIIFKCALLHYLFNICLYCTFYVHIYIFYLLFTLFIK